MSMKLSRRSANILLAIGVYMLLTWGTRVFTFLSEFRAGTLVAPAIHFSLVVIGLTIGTNHRHLPCLPWHQGPQGKLASQHAGCAGLSALQLVSYFL